MDGTCVRDDMDACYEAYSTREDEEMCLMKEKGGLKHVL